VPDRIKQSFVIFDIRALWRSGLSVPGCQKIQNDGLTRCFIITVGVKELIYVKKLPQQLSRNWDESEKSIKHPVPDGVKPSFVIFDIRALWRSAYLAGHSCLLTESNASYNTALCIITVTVPVGVVVRRDRSRNYRICADDRHRCAVNRQPITTLIYATL